MSVFTRAAAKRRKDQQQLERQGSSMGAVSEADSEELLETIRDVIRKTATEPNVDRGVAVEQLSRLQEKHHKLLAGKCITGS
ncbi:hypothetical protein [Oceanospirillum linum]|uniref:Uncharacterized protein n=1 Tax=Oceanospirillum linum TaxID=966 RepID=A0A1T1HEV5_OCELI|nr:hypothetical protein [Oceanospirillum linum]OOV88398.1 hypothetical protein BTA35_0202485 [Oceanospirillum linum]SEF54854.1 hypothetical protein SAMN04489856_101509 [Oleiphilus messinensis]SMP05019.1 hypothetical protein SAMN06264348_101510 [Oceanospirillum linum]